MEDKDELILVETVELLRSMKYDMTRHDVIHFANSMLEGTRDSTDQVALAASVVSVTGLSYIVARGTKKDDNGSSGATSKTAAPSAEEKKTQSPAETLLRMKKEEMTKVVLKPGGTGVGMRPSHTGQFDESMSTKGPDVKWKSLDTLTLNRIGSRPPGMETSTIVRQV